ncbi:MAG TPA: exodeoxyribonuclease VII large subunit [Thauera sp.]|uniref:exodeoxyribonuclease VII large subunit n=1 Tax=Thauera sp. TaxID=1905334 RepID=UPI00261462DE|nr:exodeoxyribonuclease VII large subunit [Thauera sp.]MCP5226718.1 exodeoxyribonuclease VII large subunit [Thauera sp.]HPE05324.1 exodeoxyribonuclease VII large subunit [Thauera sp.]HRV77414.1 exodeoxyribonuclease VII large subunit [Thauera sp.]
MPANPFLPANGAATPAAQVVSVSELNRMARELLESALPLMWVGGEISNLVRAASGHVYFTLKDASAQVRCAMWRNRAQLLAFRPENGMRVEARALVTLYEARGDYQLSVEALRPAGIGSLFEAFNRLKAKLAAEGLFDEEGRRALPRYPRALGIVTSPQAAALRDVLVTLRRRAPHLPVVLYPAPVQGADAPVRLLEAVRSAGRRAAEDGVDVLLLVRGGGSIEDLWAFNDEALARALRACPLPVVCGVGHETDFTIADFAADLRAPTPTGAAELASAGWYAARAELAVLEPRLRRAVERRFGELAQRLDRAALRLVHPRERLRRERDTLARLGERLRHATARRLETADLRTTRAGLRLRAAAPRPQALAARVDMLGERLARAATRLLEARSQRLEALAAHLQHLAPQAVLARGYAIARDERGRVLRNAASVPEGSAVSVQLADGRLDTRVLGHGEA